MEKDTSKIVRQAGLEMHKTIPVEAITKLIKRSTGIEKISISDVKIPDGTGASSGSIFFSCELENNIREQLFLKYDTQAPVRPFHQYDLAGQFAVQKVLFEEGIPVPEPLYLDAEGEDLGCTGYVMKVVTGEIGSHKPWMEGALATAPPDSRDAMLADAIKQMVRMHAIDFNRPELLHLSQRAAGKTSIEREINWIIDLAAYQEFSDPRIDKAVNVLMARIPTTWTDSFIHGDNKFDNYLFSNDKVSAIIDFEMSTVAPREMDLAWLLVLARLTTPPENPRPAWFPDTATLVKAYEKASGYSICDFSFYEDLTALKFSVMALAYAHKLGVLEQMPEMFVQYWSAIESIIE